MNKSTGLRQRSENSRRRFAAERSYAATLLPLATVLQPVVFTHDQLSKPSCVGQAWTGRIEAHSRTRGSAVDLWTDARRRQGDLENPLVGTDSEHAIESLINRGLSPYVAGEDERQFNEDQELASLAQELAADDDRLLIASEHRTITGSRLRQVVDALQRGKAVCTGGGVLPGYQSLGVNQIAGANELGPNGDGHEQGVAGYIAEDDTRFPDMARNCLIFANSWGAAWAGVVSPMDWTLTDGSILVCGSLLKSCVLVQAQIIDTQWDCDTLDVAALVT